MPFLRVAEGHLVGSARDKLLSLLATRPEALGPFYRGYVSWPRGFCRRFCPGVPMSQRQQNFEAEAVTPLFHGLEIRTSVVIVIFLTLGA
jgi:hypothetical protein